MPSFLLTIQRLSGMTMTIKGRLLSSATTVEHSQAKNCDLPVHLSYSPLPSRWNFVTLCSVGKLYSDDHTRR